MSDTTAPIGAAPFAAFGPEFNRDTFLVAQLIARVNTATLVKIISVTNAGGVSPVGSVDVQPLVNQIDGAGNAVPHGVVHNLPYFRLQGGANAVILDPQVGDIGLAAFCSRDISSVKANKAQANPGSRRRFSMSDGVYVGGMLNGTPTQFIAFSGSGIAITSTTKVTVTAPEVDVISSNVRLGGTGGKRVVLDGDPVTTGGTVTATSTDVWAA